MTLERIHGVESLASRIGHLDVWFTFLWKRREPFRERQDHWTKGGECGKGILTSRRARVKQSKKKHAVVGTSPTLAYKTRGRRKV